jgi:hypothetical protein
VRVYVAERDRRTGEARVWVLERPPWPPSPPPAGGLPAGLRPPPLSGAPRPGARRPVFELEAPPGGFGWGGRPGGDDLARAILAGELGEDPPAPVLRAFRAQVLDPLAPEGGFELTAEDVWAWVRANRRLVEVELFERPPAPPEPAAPAPDPPEPAAPGAPAGAAGTTPAAASAVVAALEGAWGAIRAAHPEVPEAVIVLGSGVERGRLVKLGHFADARWVADGRLRGEVLLAGEALHLPAEDVLGVLLHEAAHGLCAARGVRDTSRDGRYHNARFAAAARELGLRVRAAPPHGLARTLLGPEARERYAGEIVRIGEVMRIARRLGAAAGAEPGPESAGDADSAGATRRGGGGRTAAACACGRSLRVAPGVLAAGPIICGLCGAEFAATGRAAAPRDPAPRRGVVDDSFLERRRRALTGRDPVPPGGPPGPVGDWAADWDFIDLMREVARHYGLPDPVRSLVRVVGRRLVPPGGAQPSGAAGPAGWDAEDLAAAQAWYDRFGSIEEAPMAAADEAEAERRTALARALLRVDGTLAATGVVLGGREWAAGDRVVATADDPATGLPAGALGLVTWTDPAGGDAEFDFATWGAVRASEAPGVVAVLRHAYVSVGPCPADQEPPEPPGAGWHPSRPGGPPGGRGGRWPGPPGTGPWAGREGAGPEPPEP